MRAFIFLSTFLFSTSLVAVDSGLEVQARYQEDLKKADTSSKGVSNKKVDIAKNITFNYEENPLEVVTGYLGNASYRVEYDQSGKDTTYITFGGGYLTAESDVPDFTDLNENCATAQVGILFEKLIESNLSTTLGIDVSQPVYDAKQNFAPSVTMSAGLKF